MRCVIWTLLLGAGLVGGQAAPNQPLLPQWLVPYPGASAATSVAATNLVESSYAATAKAADVSGHYAKLFAAAGLAFQTSFDGLGTAIRASAPECDLLIQIRESSSGTRVKVDCSSKQIPSLQSASADNVIVANGGTSHHLKSVEEIKRYNEERVRESKARQESIAQAGIARMQQYDNPVYPQAQPAPLARYHDDAPALVWPSWLTAINGERLSQPTQSSRGPESSLSCKYQTTVTMTQLERFYQQVLQRNGFTLRKRWVGTGSTSTGVKQNASGGLEGYREEGNGINPPATTIKVGFNRNYLNEPITVWITVSVKGSFGR